MTEFQKWWQDNKSGVCFDICHRLGLSLDNPQHELELMHIACQGWVGSACKESTEKLEENTTPTEDTIIKDGPISYGFELHSSSWYAYAADYDMAISKISSADAILKLTKAMALRLNNIQQSLNKHVPHS